MNQPESKNRFFLRNFLKGFIWLVAIILAFHLLKNNPSCELSLWLNKLNASFVLTIFSLSELLFGIIPPEAFMVWALKFKSPGNYAIMIVVFSVISVFCGIIGFYFGLYLYNTSFVKEIKRRFLNKYDNFLKTYGVYLLIVAALTPLPFSGICMMIGASKYSFTKFLTYIPFRFLRFTYAIFIWKANLL